MAIGENHTVSRELIDIGRLDILGPLKPKIRITQIIGKDQQNIWLLRLRERRDRQDKRNEYCEI